MIGIYFSGTGNSRYCVEKFLQEYDITANSYSIEDNELYSTSIIMRILFLVILCNIVMCQKY